MRSPCSLAFALAALGATSLHAADFTVPCSVPDLVNAFNAVEAGADPVNTINLAAGCTYTLTAANGTDVAAIGDSGLPKLVRPQDLTINGNDSVIERSSAGGTPEFRLMQFGTRSSIPPAGKLVVRINNVILRNGLLTDPSGDMFNFRNGGAIMFTSSDDGVPGEDDELHLLGVRLEGNTAKSGGALVAVSFGGAAVVRTDNTVFDNNRAFVSGGAIHFESVRGRILDTNIQGNLLDPTGGAPTDGFSGAGGLACYTCSDLEITDTVISGNAATGTGAGGLLIAGTGRLNAGAPPFAVRILRSRIENNQALKATAGPQVGNGGHGGGLAVMEGFNDLVAEVDIVGSVILNNSAEGRGGGIATAGDHTDAIDDPVAPTRLRIINSTLSGNQAEDAAGGIAIGGGQVSLIHTTVSNNSARYSGGVGIGHYDYGGLFDPFDFDPNPVTVGSARFINTLVGGNTSTDATFASPDCAIEENTVADGGGVVENVFSLIRLDAAPDAIDYRCGATFPFAITADPLLGPLADNGGSGQSHLPLVGSPAIDAGDDAAIPVDLNLTTDQRGAGFPRLRFDAVDIGAIETDNAAAPVANDDVIEVGEGGTATILLGGAASVRSNDTDAEDGQPTGNVTVVTQPQFGTLNLSADGSFNYTHDDSENFIDSFTYTVSDSAGVESNLATVAITILPVNSAPVAVDDALSVLAGGSATTLDGGASSVRDNDTDVEDGVPAGAVAITVQPQFGSLTPNADGSFGYTHDGGADTADSFRYTVQDSEGAVSNEATVSISVFAEEVFADGFEALN